MGKFVLLFVLFIAIFIAVSSGDDSSDLAFATYVDTDSDVDVQNERSGLGRIRYYHARKCAGIRECYYLYLVNTNKNEILVSRIEGASKFDVDRIEEYILSGTIVSGNNNQRVLRVQNTYRLLPYDGPQTLDLKTYYFYNNHVAYELNTGKSYPINYYTENYSERINLIDEDWLEKKIEGHSVLYGRVYNNQLSISLIFIQLPDPQYGCPNFPVYLCENTYVNTYTRDSNRCYSSTGCVKEGFCLLYIPVCSPGYTLVGARSKPNGCQKYYCDAYYLV
ncbi:hypothetical protein CYY_004166 [Polysphondylium violaceum]|uniref:Carbohydrate binding domain-containing protein n=1 Tax=Polysphondylium violaceum TaxID=133409 RepID=A0A8J4PXF7_9MYCE|nr:hypothetical protein CYY_004166 [Polysphondylium violaceum]